MRQLKFSELCHLFGPYINLAGAINVAQGELICRQIFNEMCKPPAKPFDPALYESDVNGMELMTRSGEVVRWVAKPVGDGGRAVYTLIANNKMRMFNWESGQLDRAEEGPHDLMMRIIDKPAVVSSGLQAEMDAAAPAQPVPPPTPGQHIDLAHATAAIRRTARNAQPARRGVLEVDPLDGLRRLVVQEEAADNAIREARGEVAARFVEVPPQPELLADPTPLNNNF